MKIKKQAKTRVKTISRPAFTPLTKPGTLPDVNAVKRPDTATSLDPTTHLGHNFGAINVHPATRSTIHPKLKVGPVNDQDETNTINQGT